MAAFDKYLRAILDQAGAEARRDGSATIEAQHILLAMAADPAGAAGTLLASAGLDRAAVRSALDREFEHSLSVAGVSRSAFGLPPATPDPDRTPRPGSSVQLALERAVAAASSRREMGPADLLLSILRAEVGTVPRALELAGVDRAALTARVAAEAGTR